VETVHRCPSWPYRVTTHPGLFLQSTEGSCGSSAFAGFFFFFGGGWAVAGRWERSRLLAASGPLTRSTRAPQDPDAGAPLQGPLTVKTPAEDPIDGGTKIHQEGLGYLQDPGLLRGREVQPGGPGLPLHHGCGETRTGPAEETSRARRRSGSSGSGKRERRRGGLGGLMLKDDSLLPGVGGRGTGEGRSPFPLSSPLGSFCRPPMRSLFSGTEWSGGRGDHNEPLRTDRAFFFVYTQPS